MANDSILDNMDQDEVIADSEGEDEEMEMDPFEQEAGKKFISSVSAFTTTATKDTPNRTVSSISEFTAGPSRRKLDDISPAFALDKQTHEMQGQDNTSFGGTLSIADRAKTRQRTQTKRKADGDPLDVIELTSDDEDDDLPKPPPKSKARTRPKARLKTKDTKDGNGKTRASPEPPKETTKEPLRPRPRPRPRPIPKPDGSNPLPPHPYPFGRQPQNPFLQGLLLPQKPPTPPPQSSQSRGDDIPIATSPPRVVLSQLPPSDPPQPSTYQQEAPSRNALPPIEVLKDAGSDRRSSSPSSFVGEKASSTSRRKKKIPADEQDHMEVDQLQSSPSSGAYMPPPKLVLPPKRKASPPPTFFAASSSSAGLQDRQDPPEVPIPAQDVVDLTDLPPTIAPVKPKKPKAKKKKADDGEDLYLDGVQPMRILDEDDNDGDFDPTGDGSGTGKKTKAKSKAKPKKPKENKAKVVVEVVVPAKPKGKGKGKEKQAKETEAFKSREFIGDSDEDDADPLRLVGSGEASSKVVDESSTVYVKPRLDDTGPPTADAGPSGSAGSSKSSKGGPAQDDQANPKRKTKKRKSAVEPDANDEDEEEPIKVKKPRKSNKKVVLDDDQPSQSEHEHQPTPKSKDSFKGRRQSKVVASDGEDEPVADMQVESEEPVEKENKSPPKLPQRVASTPRPTSRAPSAFPEGSTPLYTRYEVAPRRSSLPMSELIRRASSKPASPFSSSTPNVKDKSKSKASRPNSDAVGSPAPSTPISTYSPFLKSSRRLLSRIAPLHPNRRTPPPPPPPPLPKKKTKKELEMEEKWEEELVDEVGGIEAFAAMDEVERKVLRRAKRDREMYGFED